MMFICSCRNRFGLTLALRDDSDVADVNVDERQKTLEENQNLSAGRQMDALRIERALMLVLEHAYECRYRSEEEIGARPRQCSGGATSTYKHSTRRGNVSSI